MGVDRLKSLFAEANALADDERAAFEAALREQDPLLADELLSLLAADAEAGAFLAHSASASLHHGSEFRASHIGPYRVTRLIAQGGMGEVFDAVAEGQRVAVKVMRTSAMTPELVKRFTLERRTLARLEHPNIARLLDGGTTAEGMPYIAMEFIEGERLDHYCNHHSLSIDERLNLFLTACSAVQYAHGRLIVHRDLKPTNILVTAEGVPKLLDFGIAKLLSPDDDTHRAEPTLTRLGIYTPEFASPEQTEGKEITTASDVYSLGVILYLLLTGRKPFDPPGNSPRAATILMHEQEPPAPSSREVTLACADGPQRARKRLRGELDTIILTALEHDPARRYISVEQFAEDIRRHLDHLPIQARHASVGRRITKFVRRNPALTAAVILVVVALSIGVAVMMYEVQRTREQHRRDESINAFLQQMLSFTNPMQQIPGASRTSTVMEDALDNAEKRLEGDEFARQPEIRLQLERILGEAYGHQGRYDRMYVHFHRYFQLCAAYPGMDDPRSLDTLALWAGELFAKGQFAQSEGLYRQTLPRMLEQVREGTMKLDLYAGALNNFGYLRRTQGDSHEAEVSFREVLQLTPRISSETHFMISVTRATLASVLADQGKFQEALHTAEEGIAECRRLDLSSTPDFGFIQTIYGGFLTEVGRYDEADSALSEASRAFDMISDKSLWTGDLLRNRASLAYQRERYAQALEFATKALSIYRDNFGIHYDNYPTALIIRGLSLSRLRRVSEGEAVLREALTMRTTSLPAGHFFTSLAQSALGECLTHQRRFDEAEPLLTQSYTDLLRTQGPENPRTTLARRRLKEMYLAWSKPDRTE